MTMESILLNPNGRLLADIERRLFRASKTKSLWAKQLHASQEISTLEGTLVGNAGDWLCRGVQGEFWPQSPMKLKEKYSPSNDVDAEGWERFEPKPESAPVEAAQVATPFRVKSQWGELNGKAQDYVVRSTTDPSDIWIVSRAIFDASYEPLTHSNGNATA